MYNEPAFLAAIREAPNDAAPRLIYADWLEQQGDPRSEFIRVQCQLASDTTLTDERRQKLEARQEALLEVHQQEWEKPLRKLGATDIRFRLGMPDHITIDLTEFLANGEQLFSIAPITSAYIIEDESHSMRALAASPNLAKLSALSLRGNHIGDEGARALAGSPHLLHLTKLALAFNSIGPAGAQALAASPHLSHLTTLGLSSNRIGDAGARALANSPYLADLTTLKLFRNGIGNPGAQALAASPHLSHLTTLDVGDNYIGEAGLQALAASSYLADLATLNISGNHIGPNAIIEIIRRLEARSTERAAGRGV